MSVVGKPLQSFCASVRREEKKKGTLPTHTSRSAAGWFHTASAPAPAPPYGPAPPPAPSPAARARRSCRPRRPPRPCPVLPAPPAFPEADGAGARRGRGRGRRRPAGRRASHKMALRASAPLPPEMRTGPPGVRRSPGPTAARRGLRGGEGRSLVHSPPAGGAEARSLGSALDRLGRTRHIEGRTPPPAPPASFRARRRLRRARSSAAGVASAFPAPARPRAPLPPALYLRILCATKWRPRRKWAPGRPAHRPPRATERRLRAQPARRGGSLRSDRYGNAASTGGAALRVSGPAAEELPWGTRLSRRRQWRAGLAVPPQLFLRLSKRWFKSCQLNGRRGGARGIMGRAEGYRVPQGRPVVALRLRALSRRSSAAVSRRALRELGAALCGASSGFSPTAGSGRESFRWLWCSLASQNHRTAGAGRGFLEVANPPLKYAPCGSPTACWRRGRNPASWLR